MGAALIEGRKNGWSGSRLVHEGATIFRFVECDGVGSQTGYTFESIASVCECMPSCSSHERNCATSSSEDLASGTYVQ